MHRYGKLKRMHVNKTPFWFCLTGWASTNVLVTTGGLRKGPHSRWWAFDHWRKKTECDTREGWYGGSFFNINFFFFSGCILREEYFLPCCEAVLVFQQKAQGAWRRTDKIILSCASWNVAHQTSLCWVVKEPVSFRCYWDRTHCFHRPWELCP